MSQCCCLTQWTCTGKKNLPQYFQHTKFADQNNVTCLKLISRIFIYLKWNFFFKLVFMFPPSNPMSLCSFSDCWLISLYSLLQLTHLRVIPYTELTNFLLFPSTADSFLCDPLYRVDLLICIPTINFFVCIPTYRVNLFVCTPSYSVNLFVHIPSYSVNLFVLPPTELTCVCSRIQIWFNCFYSLQHLTHLCVLPPKDVAHLFVFPCTE